MMLYSVVKRNKQIVGFIQCLIKFLVAKLGTELFMHSFVTCCSVLSVLWGFQKILRIWETLNLWTCVDSSNKTSNTKIK